jgi:hypothetical protein
MIVAIAIACDRRVDYPYQLYTEIMRAVTLGNPVKSSVEGMASHPHLAAM